MQYDLSRLGDGEFEDLSQALAVRVLGTAIQVFGDGPDGGREASFEGIVDYPSPSPSTPWNGYGVLQAKFKRRPTTTADDTAWLKRQIRGELERWLDATSKRARSNRLPQYLLFTTNVFLSSTPGGGIESTLELIAEYQGRLGLTGWDIWHGERICRFLDNFPELRQTYAGFITPGDVLANLQDMLDRHHPPDLTGVLSTHAAKEMLAQKYVRLNESGGSGVDRLSLGSVAVDIPAQSSDGLDAGQLSRDSDSAKESDRGIIAEIIRSGDTVHSDRAGRDSEPHIAIIGGPGQGKSTIGQLVCQAYRAALLRHRPMHIIGREAGDYLGRLTTDLDELGIPTPGCLRWPIQVNLAKYGDAIARGGDVSLLQHVSSIMAARTEVSSHQLKTWLGLWPWLIVLDGLDEVAVPTVRESMRERISDFFVDAASVDADVLVVATTRPQGYGQEFSEPYFRHWNLAPLSRAAAIKYARRLADARHGDDPDFQQQLVERIVAASREPIMGRLMRTPLQVTILSLLLERRARVPEDRYGLFESYYNTLYDREISKGTSVARLLRGNRRHIDFLHERVGLLLQIRAERAGSAESLMGISELRNLLLDRLKQEGFDETEAGRLADELINASTDRLVMLAPIQAGHVGFEIRSLQELMAAKALSAGSDNEIVVRLEAFARSAHWRNTWLFMASRLFTQREHLRDKVVTLLNVIDTDSRFHMFVATGVRLAIDLMDVGHPQCAAGGVRAALGSQDLAEAQQRPPPVLVVPVGREPVEGVYEVRLGVLQVAQVVERGSEHGQRPACRMPVAGFLGQAERLGPGSDDRVRVGPGAQRPCQGGAQHRQRQRVPG
jgi:hypothetical protein